MKKPSPPVFVRQYLFKMNEKEFAEACGIHYQTVLKMEQRGDFGNIKTMRNVRAAARRRRKLRKMWDVNWLFDTPDNWQELAQ
jgi:hypothetical protein